MHSKSIQNPASSPVAVELKKSKQMDITTTATSEAVKCAHLSHVDLSNVNESKHPVVVAKIDRLRRKETDCKLYRELMYEIGTFLAYEATSDLTLTEPKTVTF